MDAENLLIQFCTIDFISARLAVRLGAAHCGVGKSPSKSASPAPPDAPNLSVAFVLAFAFIALPIRPPPPLVRLLFVEVVALLPLVPSRCRFDGLGTNVITPFLRRRIRPLSGVRLMAARVRCMYFASLAPPTASPPVTLFDLLPSGNRVPSPFCRLRARWRRLVC